MSDLKDRLKSIQATIEETRSERADKVKVRDQAKDAFAKTDLSNSDIVSSAEFQAAQEAVRELGEVDDKLNDLAVAERGVLSMLGETGGATSTPGRQNGNGPEDGLPKTGAEIWSADKLLNGDKYRELIESGAPHSKARLGAVSLGTLASREQAQAFMSADVGSDDKLGATAADRRGFVLPNLRPLTLLDLIPVGTTDSNSVEYVQIITIPEQAAETAEGSTKPEAQFLTEDADAPVRTIAGWIKVRKQALADIAGLRSIIGQLLPYDVKRRIESQMLVGNGVGQNLTGIINTDGVGSPDPVSGDNAADAILRAVTLIVLSDGDPNFVALNPLGWQDLLLMRENQAARTGAYLYGSPAMPAAPSIWGLAITKNRVVPQDQPVVGDSNAATLLVREGVNVLVSDSDQDDFIKNRATILAEARVAFPIWRPTSFAVAQVGDESGS